MRQRVAWPGHVPVLGSGSAYVTYGFSSMVTTFKWYLSGRPLGGVG